MEIDTAPAEPDAAPKAPETPGRPSRWSRAAGIICWSSVALVAIFTVVRVGGLERTYYVDNFMAYTPYMTLLSVFPLVFTVVVRRWRATVVAALCTATLVSLVAPRIFGGPDPGKGPVLHVMSSNMRVGGADPATIVRLAREHHVDLLAIQEYTPAARAALAEDGLRSLFVYVAETPLGGAGGSALFSRYPLTDAGYQHLSGGFGQEYATLHVPDAAPIYVASVHTCAPVHKVDIGCWARSLAKEPPATPSGRVNLLIGDFNATLDHARFRTLLDTGYRDVAYQLGDGLDTTWPYEAWSVPPITIDHFLADPRIGALYFGSAPVRNTDHKTIWATLTLPGS